MDRQSGIRIFFVVISFLAVLAFAMMRFNSSEQEVTASKASSIEKVNSSAKNKQSGLKLLHQASKDNGTVDSVDDSDPVISFPEQFTEARSHLNEKERQSSLKSLAAKLAIQSPGDAVDLFSQFLPITKSNLPDATAFVSGFTESLAKDNPIAALEWTELLPDDVLYGAYHSVMTVWSDDAPMQATEWLLEIPDSKLKELLFRNLSSRIAQSGSPGLIGSWARTVADTQLGIQQSGVLASVWGEIDPQSTFDWAFDKIEDSSSRKAAFSALAKGLQKQDFHIAADWANKFPEEDNIRFSAVRDTIYLWRKRNPDEALHWMGVNEIDPGSFPTLFGPKGLGH